MQLLIIICIDLICNVFKNSYITKKLFSFYLGSNISLKNIFLQWIYSRYSNIALQICATQKISFSDYTLKKQDKYFKKEWMVVFSLVKGTFGNINTKYFATKKRIQQTLGTTFLEYSALICTKELSRIFLYAGFHSWIKLLKGHLRENLYGRKSQ